jgi:hypothetical protein
MERQSSEDGASEQTAATRIAPRSFPPTVMVTRRVSALRSFSWVASRSSVVSPLQLRSATRRTPGSASSRAG